MIKINPFNDIVQKGGRRTKPVPGFTGYFVGPDDNIYSAWGLKTKILKPFYAIRNGSPIGRPRVCLINDNGVRVNILVDKVFLWALGEDEVKMRAQKKSDMEISPEEEDLMDSLGDLF